MDYIDTANYEPENTDDPAWREIYEKRCKELGFSAYFDYSWQWAYDERFRKAGLTGLLGTGFEMCIRDRYHLCQGQGLQPDRPGGPAHRIPERADKGGRQWSFGLRSGIRRM